MGRLFASGQARSSVTVDWLGFTQVLDGALQPVANYSVVSASGVDWSQLVPEPGSGASALAALVCVAGLGYLGRRPAPRPTP